MSRTDREEHQEERSGGEASQFQFAYCSLPAAPPPSFLQSPIQIDSNLS